MNHNGDKSPSMDLDELLRRHDQFKQRQARTPGPAARPHAPAQRPVIKRPAPVETSAAEELAAPIPAEPAVEETPVQAAPVEDVAVEPEAVSDVFVDDAEVIDDPSDDESTYSDEDYDEAEFEREPNPFDSMFSVFRSAFGKLHRKKGSDDEEFYEDEFENEVFDESSEPDMPEDEASESSAESEPVQEDVPAAPVEDIEDIASIEDVEDLSASEPLDNDFADDFDDEELDAQSEKKKGLLGWLKKKKNVEEDESYAFDDSDYADEDYVAEEFPDKEEHFPEDMPAEPIDFENEPAQAADVEDLADLADLPTEEPSEYSASAFGEDDFEEDEEYGEEVADPNQPSGLRKFLNLFIVREDDDAETSDEEDDWTDDSFESDGWNEYDRPEDSSCTDTRFAADDRHSDPTGAMDSAPSDFRLFRDTADIEGGTIDMDEKNRVNTDMTELLATGLESQGMSRRERRELAARLAAEEAALRAAETSSVAEDAPVETPEVIAEEPETEKPVTDSFGIPDEPTRIFKPLSSFSRPIEESAPAAEPAPIEPDDEEDFDDEEDEEEDKHSRFSLFRKKHAEKDDEDEEDFDEDDEDFDEDDEDDEPVEKKPRRSLFAKKSRSIKYDEDEEELDEEDDSFDNDEDDEDEYDEYDDFDDEYDDEDYDDEDDDLNDGRPLGIRIVGFFKGLFAFVLCVLIVVFALNFLDYFNVLSLDSVFEHHYNKAPAVFDTLFPSHNLKKLIKPDETIEAIVPEPTVVSDSVTPVPDAVQATEAPVSTTPVPEAAQATETPAVG